MPLEHPARPRVLVLTAHYAPGYKAGGPIRSIHNVVSALGDEFDFRVFTSDRDYGDTTPYPSVNLNCWTPLNGALVFYADRLHRRALRLGRLIGEVNPDIVYLNSFFSRAYSILPLMSRRIGLVGSNAAWIVAPRGELSAGALSLKPRRKRGFMRMAAALGLHRDVLWQATSPEEAADLRDRAGVPENSIRLATNLTAPVGAYSPPAQMAWADGPLRVCFLSRVCRKKNLKFAVEILCEVRRPLEFHVYGPVEDRAYADECQSLVGNAHAGLRIVFHGDVPHDDVRRTLARHHLFFLPTLGENFGHVIFEALAAGVPVLISDRTPWRNLEEHGAGWVKPLAEPWAFVSVVQSVADTPAVERQARARRAHGYAADYWHRHNSPAATRDLFLAAIERHRSGG